MKRLILFIVLLLGSTAGHAQFATLTDTGVTDLSGASLASGTECFTPVNNAGVPIPAQYSGGTITKNPKCSTITNGTMASMQIVESTETQPVNLCYQRTITDNTTGAVLIGKGDGYGCVQVTTSTLNLNTVAPNLPSLVEAQYGPTGATGPVGPVGPQGAPGSSTLTGDASLNSLTINPNSNDFFQSITDAFWFAPNSTYTFSTITPTYTPNTAWNVVFMGEWLTTYGGYGCHVPFMLEFNYANPNVNMCGVPLTMGINSDGQFYITTGASYANGYFGATFSGTIYFLPSIGGGGTGNEYVTSNPFFAQLYGDISTTGSVTGSVLNATSSFEANGTAGYSGTKTAGSCTFTITGGIITAVSGC